jgi:hypothetical protein
MQAFLDAVVNLEFQTVESVWREFWRSQDVNNGDECEEEKYLSKYVLSFFYSTHVQVYIGIKFSPATTQLRFLCWAVSKGDFRDAK